MGGANWNLTEEDRSADAYSAMHIIGDIFLISKGMVLNSDEKKAKGAFKKDDLVQDEQDAIHSKKCIEGKDVDRYAIKKHRFLEWDTERCPGQLSRATFPELYTSPKLLVNSLGEMKATFDRHGEYYCVHYVTMLLPWHKMKHVQNKSIDAIVAKYSRRSREEMEGISALYDLRYVLAILNSRFGATLLTFIRDGDYHIYPEHLRNIPIAPATPEQQAEIAALVDEILAAKEADPNADITSQMAAIDEKVYALYGVEPPIER